MKKTMKMKNLKNCLNYLKSLKRNYWTIKSYYYSKKN